MWYFVVSKFSLVLAEYIWLIFTWQTDQSSDYTISIANIILTSFSYLVEKCGTQTE